VPHILYFGHGMYAVSFAPKVFVCVWSHW